MHKTPNHAHIGITTTLRLIFLGFFQSNLASPSTTTTTTNHHSLPLSHETMPETFGSTSDADSNSIRFTHSISEAGRLLPSASRWNSIELDFNILPQSSSNPLDSLPSKYSKSFEFDLVITDKKHFKRFLYISITLFFVIVSLILLLHFLPHKHKHHGPSKNLTLALNQALVFFDAQKSGILPKNSSVKFRGDSGLQDGNTTNLVGGFYDSGNNVKFSFPTAYTITLLSWTVIEYHEKYEDIGELDHVKDIIKWGSDYLLKIFAPPNITTSSPTILYSQVGSTSNDTAIDNNINCWQRPEDMTYPRPASTCVDAASDLAGEIVAALSAASLVFKEDQDYSEELTKTAEKLFEVALIRVDPRKQVPHTMTDACQDKDSKEERQGQSFYNSTSSKDELVWGGIWLYFATGNTSYLGYATDRFSSAAEDEATLSDRGVFYWNNKLTASAVLLTRLRFFRDLGFPYEAAFGPSANMTDLLMCSYLSKKGFLHATPGGLILLKPAPDEPPLQYAATASFLSKLYSDYLDLLRRSGGSCRNNDDFDFSLDMLRSFSMSQVNYILGDNPMKMSYMVGYGDHYPTQVHHRSASIPWDDDRNRYSCAEGDRWLHSKDPNPNILVGAMVGGPDQFDNFIDERDKPLFTEPTISSNAGLVAALIALHDPPRDSSGKIRAFSSGIDQMGIFVNVRLTPSTT